jgi:hypothetical protein
MYNITVNEDETIEIDAWSTRLNVAHELRPEVWDNLISKWEKEMGVPDFDVTPVRNLFCTLRIDGLRALRMLEAKGDTTVAPIDPLPEHAMAGENQLLEDEIVNEDRTFVALQERLGMMSVDFGLEEDLDAFLNMRETLRSEGKILPGLRGI